MVNSSSLGATAQKVAMEANELGSNEFWRKGFLGKGGISGWTIAIAIIISILIFDQVRYLLYKQNIAGPKFTIPIMGAFLDSMNPTFENYLAQWNSGPLSCVSVFHQFVVIASSRDLSRKIFQSPSFVKPCVVDIAIKLLRPTNFVFLDGKVHNEFRKGLNGLFRRNAMALYLPGQEEMYDKYLELFVEMSRDGPAPFKNIIRELNTAVSCRSFVGKYIDDEQVKKIADDYYLITAALELVNFPIILPFTKTWYGKKTTDMVMETFAKCAEKSREHVKNGGEITCILDEWIYEMEQTKKWEAEEKHDPEAQAPMYVREFTNKEISETLFAFLFASQDATSSALCFLFQIVANRPDVMEKLREEQIKVREGDLSKPLSIDMVDQMEYTRAVVKELLRFRPPVIMVPYKTKKSFPITPEYTVPKGAMVIPSTYPALHDPEVYPDPEEFIPDRWLTGDAEKQNKNWLVFGVGPHYCLGQNVRNYILLLLLLLLLLLYYTKC